MYDIIGDIHGHYDLLVYTLQQLGYSDARGSFSHPERKAVFVGDIIDRGSKTKDSVALVRRMVENEHALTVLGNHEYNFLCYNSWAGSGEPLRPHTNKNRGQISHTLQSYHSYDRELEDDLTWFRSLPLFIELEDFRVVHAAWIPKDVEFIRTNYPDNQLTDQLLFRSADNRTAEFKVIEHLLKGIETPLPIPLSYADNDGNRRIGIRLKWWQDSHGKTLREMAVRPPNGLDHQPFLGHEVKLGYEAEQKPVFFGHYCLSGEPGLIATNVCCLDFCIYRRARLVVYRWDGEQVLNPHNLHCFSENGASA